MREDGKPFEFVKSARGNFMLVVHGFVFAREVKRNDKILWRCSRYSKLKCTARCSTGFQHSTIVFKSGHNHAPEGEFLQHQQRYFFAKVGDMIAQSDV